MYRKVDIEKFKGLHIIFIYVYLVSQKIKINKMKKIILSLVGVLFSTITLSQSIQIDEVRGMRFSGVQPIMSDNGESVAGYYTYYLADKGEKGMRTLEFCIIDKATKFLRLKLNCINLVMKQHSF